MLAGSGAGEEQGRKFIKLEPRGARLQRFEFPSYELAFEVREVVYLRLIEFDKNGDEEFQEDEIRDFLEKVLGEDGPEVQYFVKNVFRYDYNGDGRIEYDQLVNFCMEQHFGQIAIQRLHRKKLYHRGHQRIMNLPQFIQTINYALSFIEFAPQESDIRIAFEVVDQDKDGFISYQDYFRFLKQYFGSKSKAAKLVNKTSVLDIIHDSRGSARETNIIDKYQKNEEKRLSPQKHTKSPNKDKPLPVQPHSQLPPLINPHPQQPPQPGSTSARESMKGSIANNNQRKPKPPNSSGNKLELTLLNRNDKKETQSQISLSEQQRAIAERIARLVLSQLKVILIGIDTPQKCKLPADLLFSFMRSFFGYSQFMQSEVYKRGILSRDRDYSYQEATKIAITEQIYFILGPLEHGRNLSKGQFVEVCSKVCGVVKNTPLVSKYEGLFHRKEGAGISVGEAQALLLFIFNHCWKD